MQVRYATTASIGTRGSKRCRCPFQSEFLSEGSQTRADTRFLHCQPAAATSIPHVPPTVPSDTGALSASKISTTLTSPSTLIMKPASNGCGSNQVRATNHPGSTRTPVPKAPMSRSIGLIDVPLHWRHDDRDFARFARSREAADNSQQSPEARDGEHHRKKLYLIIAHSARKPSRQPIFLPSAYVRP